MPAIIAWQPSDKELKVVETSPNGRYIRYNVLLGKGACKRVYKALDTEEGLEVAWNQVELLGLEGDEEFRQHLKEEIRVLQHLKHKNIMTFYACWYDKSNLHINFITELFTAGNLRQYRKKIKMMSENVLKRWAEQILQGLLYLHGHVPPIVHRDLKCDNIFINSATGEIKIGDLGLATVQQTAMSVVGTPEFMAPEVYEESYDERADIYSFGMCMLELATFEYPYSECRSIPQVFKKVTLGIPPASLERVTSPELRHFIALCIRHDSAERPTARELLKHPYLESVRVPAAESYGSSGSVLSPGGNGSGWNTPSGTLHCATSVRDLRDTLHHQEALARHMQQLHQHVSSPLISPSSDSAPVLSPAGGQQPVIVRTMTDPTMLPPPPPMAPPSPSMVRSASAAAIASPGGGRSSSPSAVGGGNNLAAAAAPATSPRAAAAPASGAGAGGAGGSRSAAASLVDHGPMCPFCGSSPSSSDSVHEGGTDSDSDEEVLVPIELVKAGLLQEGFVDPSTCSFSEPRGWSPPSAVTLVDPAIMASGLILPYGNNHSSSYGRSQDQGQASASVAAALSGALRQRPARGRPDVRQRSWMAMDSSRQQCEKVEEGGSDAAEGGEEGREGEYDEEEYDEGMGGEGVYEPPNALNVVIDLDLESQRRRNSPSGGSASGAAGTAAAAEKGEGEGEGVDRRTKGEGEGEGVDPAPSPMQELAGSRSGSAALAAPQSRGGSLEAEDFSIGAPSEGCSGTSTPTLRVMSYGAASPSVAAGAGANMPLPPLLPSAAAAPPSHYRTPPPYPHGASSVGGALTPPLMPNSAPPTKPYLPSAFVCSGGSISGGGAPSFVRLPSFRNMVMLTMQTPSSFSLPPRDGAGIAAAAAANGRDGGGGGEDNADESAQPTRCLRTTSCRLVGGVRLADAGSFSSSSTGASAGGVNSGEGGGAGAGTRSFVGGAASVRAGRSQLGLSAAAATTPEQDLPTRSTPPYKLEAVPEAADSINSGGTSDSTTPAEAVLGSLASFCNDAMNAIAAGAAVRARGGNCVDVINAIAAAGPESSPISGLGASPAGAAAPRAVHSAMAAVPAERAVDGAGEDAYARRSAPVVRVAAAWPAPCGLVGGGGGRVARLLTSGNATSNSELTVVREFARPIQGVIMRLKQWKRLMGDKVKGDKAKGASRAEGGAVRGGL